MHFTATFNRIIIQHFVVVYLVALVMINSIIYINGTQSIRQQVEIQKKILVTQFSPPFNISSTSPVTDVILSWRYIHEQEVKESVFSTSWSSNTTVYELGVVTLEIRSETVWLVYWREFLVANIIWALLFAAMLMVGRYRIQHAWDLLKRLEIWADKLTKHRKYKFFIADTQFQLINTVRDLYFSILSAEKGRHNADHLIRSQTFLDKTTGLGNRLYFENRLEAILQEEKVYGAVLIVQFSCLDVIRDTEGKTVTKEYVEQCAETIRGYLDDTAQSVVSRISANDFAILLPFIDGDEVEKVALNILRMSQKIRWPDYIDTLSICHIGADMYGIEDSSFQILAEADMALRAAQLHGPSGWFMYDSGELPPSEIKGSVRWRVALQDALQDQLFISFFQPFVDGELKVIQNEVQTKMLDSKRELISSNVFLPMAKKCGMIQQIDKLQLEFVILQLVQDGLSPVSIKIHSDSWLDRKFCNWLIKFLKANTDYTEYLIFEISEFELYQHGKQLRKTLAAVKRYGIRYLIDQVGLYVVNTSYLDYIDASFLKLHNSISNQIAERPENQLFIRSLQSITADKKLELFVSGVESEQELIIMKRLGVAGIQGNYIKHPTQRLIPLTTEVNLDGDNLDL